MAIAVGWVLSDWGDAGDLERAALLRSHDRASVPRAATLHASFALLELARSTDRNRVSTLHSCDLLRHDRNSTYGCRSPRANRGSVAAWQSRSDRKRRRVGKECRYRWAA